jgi:hypothetical protein
MTYPTHRSMKPLVLFDDTSLNRQRIVLSKNPSLTYTCPKEGDHHHRSCIAYGTRSRLYEETHRQRTRQGGI